jgi:autotransporter-associated beta strand protein
LNWVPPQAPHTDDDIAVHLNTATINDLPAGVRLHSVTLDSGDVTGNTLELQTGGSITASGSHVLTGVLLHGPATFSPSGGDLHLVGSITGTGGVTIDAGGGSVDFEAANSYSGTTTVSGELRVFDVHAIPIGGGVTVNAGGLLRLGADLEVGSLAGDGVVDNLSSTPHTLTVSESSSTNFSGVIGGVLSLTKTGAGTLTLSGANTYTGLTTVDAGTLLVSGSLAGDVTVDAGATLTVTGTVSGTITNNGGTVVTLPGAPTAVTATRGNQQATVAWTAPASDGGSAITGYTVTSSPGGRTCTWTTGLLSCTVTGLTGGTSYTFTVTATNGIGTGPASAASNAVVPKGSGGGGGATTTTAAATTTAAPPPPPDTQPPTAPGSLAGALAGAMLTLRWVAASDDRGVDHYELQLDGATMQRLDAATTAATVRVTKPSAFTLLAFDAAGNRSAASGAVSVELAPRPAGIPDRIPGWAWQFLAWQEHRRAGPRPNAPARLPDWYWAWAAWRLNPYRLA